MLVTAPRIEYKSRDGFANEESFAHPDGATF
ncbi:MAG: hypothetical protein ACI9BW_001063, partial [Gammaproteobacteria bacterium]